MLIMNHLVVLALENEPEVQNEEYRPGSRTHQLHWLTRASENILYQDIMTTYSEKKLSFIKGQSITG